MVHADVDCIRGLGFPDLEADFGAFDPEWTTDLPFLTLQDFGEDSSPDRMSSPGAPEPSPPPTATGTQPVVPPAAVPRIATPLPIPGSTFALPPTAVSRRGGSKKRKDPDLESISDVEERKRAERKIRNKESAQSSRDRQKHHIAHLEANLQALAQANATLQHQLQVQEAEDRRLRERLRYAEGLLIKHNLAAELLTTSDLWWGPCVSSGAAPSTPACSWSCGPDQLVAVCTGKPAALGTARGPLSGSVTAFLLLFTFTLAFNCPVLDGPSHHFPEAGGRGPACPAASHPSELASGTSRLLQLDDPSDLDAVVCISNDSACSRPSTAA